MAGNKKQVETINERYGEEFWSKQGKKGGETTVAKKTTFNFSDPEFASRAGKLGGRPRKNLDSLSEKVDHKNNKAKEQDNEAV